MLNYGLKIDTVSSVSSFCRAGGPEDLMDDGMMR